MRIALLSTYAATCGIATYTDALGRVLRARGHEVRVLAMTLDGATQYYGDVGVPYIRCWTREGNYWGVEDNLTVFHPDVLHIQHEYGLHKDVARFSSWLASMRKCPIVTTLHTVPIPGNEQSVSLEWMMSVLGRINGTVIAHQEPAIAALRAYGVKRTFCIPHGTGGPFPRGDRQRVRTRLRLPVESLVFATLGFWTPGKRNDNTIRAFVSLRNRNEIPLGTVLLLAGQPIGDVSDTDQRRWCEQLERMGLSTIVQIRPGFIDESYIGDYFDAADVIIANSGPTMYSTSGRGHLAMAYGAAVLAADVPLLHEFKICGLTFASQAQLEQGIVRLAKDDALRAELRQRALNYAAQTSWSNVAAAHEAVYKEALK